jgi:prophage regulatory protein
MGDDHALVSAPEIAAMLGVSLQRVHQLMHAYDDFPQPTAELAIGRIWRTVDIEAWMMHHPRKTGRPRAEQGPIPTIHNAPAHECSGEQSQRRSTNSDGKGPPP